MKISLAYGRHGLSIDVPRGTKILSPRFIPGLQNEAGAIRRSLHSPINSPPLSDLLQSGQSVVIVHTDITRATPNDRILPVVLRELEDHGIHRGDILLLNGLGTHRPQTDAELRQMLGDEIVSNYRCLQHDCTNDDALVALGQTRLGHPVRINKDYLSADIKILTGFIEPHFFAGFSGGPKAVLPALAGAESVFTNHGQRMIAHPRATWGITDTNPIWEEMKEMALLTKPDFLINVALNSKQEIIGVFSGDMLEAHRQGCAFVKDISMVPIPRPFDWAITTNSGYPLDQNLYQSIKGMSAAARAVRPGGAILMAAACEDGLPEHGLYAQLLREAGSPEEILNTIAAPDFEAQDQWQVQIQAQIQQEAEIYVFSDGLTDEQIRGAHFSPCKDISDFVQEMTACKGPRGCVIPDGPQVIPYFVKDEDANHT